MALHRHRGKAPGAARVVVPHQQRAVPLALDDRQAPVALLAPLPPPHRLPDRLDSPGPLHGSYRHASSITRPNRRRAHR
jgi:hypothetical protein